MPSNHLLFAFKLTHYKVLRTSEIRVDTQEIGLNFEANKTGPDIANSSEIMVLKELNRLLSLNGKSEVSTNSMMATLLATNTTLFDDKSSSVLELLSNFTDSNKAIGLQLLYELKVIEGDSYLK